MDYNTYFSTEEKKIPPVIEKDIPIPRTKWETIRDYKWNHIAIIAKLNK